jgi:hypothetical protein
MLVLNKIKNYIFLILYKTVSVKEKIKLENYIFLILYKIVSIKEKLKLE